MGIVIKIILLFIIHLISFLSYLAVLYLREPDFLVVSNSTSRTVICTLLHIIICQVYVFILYKVSNFKAIQDKIIYRILNYLYLAVMIGTGILQIIIGLTI